MQKADFEAAIKTIENARRCLVLTHVRPDGDACGCTRAMLEQFEAMGKTAEGLFLSPPASWYRAMFRQPPPVLGNDLQAGQLEERYGAVDLIVIVDTNSYVQLPGLEAWIKNRPASRRVLVLDHHVTGDGIGDVEVVDTEAAAAGEIVFELFKAADWTITPSIAEAIFIALSMDTGWFRFGNTDSRIFHAAAELIVAGAKPDVIYRRMYQGFSPARLRLMTRMLEHMELHSEGRIATQYILRKDFDETGASGPDTENLIDECQRIATVEAAALLIELADGRFRCSLRSKGPVDVRAIAQKYGGGGHTLAAGVTLDGPLKKALKTVVTEIRRQMETV